MQALLGTNYTRAGGLPSGCAHLGAQACAVTSVTTGAEVFWRFVRRTPTRRGHDKSMKDGCATQEGRTERREDEKCQRLER